MIALCHWVMVYLNKSRGIFFFDKCQPMSPRHKNTTMSLKGTLPVPQEKIYIIYLNLYINVYQSRPKALYRESALSPMLPNKIRCIIKITRFLHFTVVYGSCPSIICLPVFPRVTYQDLNEQHVPKASPSKWYRLQQIYG